MVVQRLCRACRATKNNGKKYLNTRNRWNRPSSLSKVYRSKRPKTNWKCCLASLEPSKTFEWCVASKANLFPPSIWDKYIETNFRSHRNGSPKGIAYVEYENSKPVSNAILKTDGMTLKDFKINVSISEPPPKQNKAHGSVNPLLTLGQGRRTPATRGYTFFNITNIFNALYLICYYLFFSEIKPRMSFIPSSVLKKSTAAASASADLNGSTAAPAPKSNEDFRNLFKKN